MENNRKAIYHARQRHGSGGVTLLDLPFIIFGGEYELGDVGQYSITLVNAFEKTFDLKHLKAAREKCGYCPANCNALKHPKCHGGFEDDVV